MRQKYALQYTQKHYASIKLNRAFMFINLDSINISQVILSNSALQGASRVS